VRKWLGLAALPAALALLAGCGSSSKTTSSATAAAASEGSGSVGSYGGGAYGASKSGGSSTTSGTSAGAVQVETASGPLGTYLVAGPKKLTVYLFEADKNGSSACSGACASAWPPVTSTGAPTAGGSTSSAMLATITRSDGSKQVTYNGHPLYYFVQDKASGETTGQGVKAFGASWYVLAPSGAKIDKS
jgi:predicted lipoprotein with Yx(FWY)xxD motif